VSNLTITEMLNLAINMYIDMLSGEFAVYMTKHCRPRSLTAVSRVLEWQRRATFIVFFSTVFFSAHYLLIGQWAKSAAMLMTSAVVATSAVSVTRRMAQEKEDLVEQVMLQ
jgi:hypothetical protein